MSTRPKPTLAILCWFVFLAVAGPLPLQGCASAHPAPVQLADASEVSDEVLKTRVSRALAGAPGFGGESVTVDVRDGIVMLTGTVGSVFELQSLGALVRAVPGVRDIKFVVQVKQASPLSKSDYRTSLFGNVS